MKQMNGILLLVALVVPWEILGQDYQLPGNNNYYSEYYFNGRLDNALFIPESARYLYETQNYNPNFKLIPQLTHKNGIDHFHNEHVNLFSGRISEMPLFIGVSKASLVNVALHAWQEIKKWRHKRKPLPDHYTAQQCAASCINKLNLIPPQDNFERNYFATFTPEIRKKLLQNYADYLCDGYIDFLQSFPEYEKHIEQIGSLPNMLDHYFFEENRFSSRKEAIIKTRVAWLYQKVKAKQRSQRQAQQEQLRRARLEQEKQQNEKQLQDYWNRQQAESTQIIETLQKSWVENSKEYDHIEQIYKEYIYEHPASESAYEVRIEKRYQALKESIDNQKYTMQKYTVTASVRDLLAKHEIDNLAFTTCCGNQFQQILHAEFITILDEAVHIEPRDKNETSLCLPEFTQEAAACNQAGKCTQALMIADYCWSVIDGVKKFGRALISSDYVCAMVNEAMHYSLQYHHHEPLIKEDIAAKYDRLLDLRAARHDAMKGAVTHVGSTVWQAGKCIATGDLEPFCDGIKQAGSSMYHLVRHPIDSAVTMIEGAAIISYHLGKLLVQTEYTNMLFYVDPAHALTRTIDMTTNMDEIGIDLCKKFQEIPERELIVNATAFATETAALHYGGTAIGKLVASAGVAAKTSGIFEKAKQLIQPIREELRRIAQAAKEFFKSKKEIAFALEGGESIGMEVTDALVESVGAETITQTIPKMPKVIKNALPHIFSDEQQLIQLIDKFANTIFNLPTHVHEMGLASVKITEKYLKHVFGMEAVEIIEKTGKVKRKINGFHHDYLNRLEKKGVVQFFNKRVDKLTGIMKADGKYLAFVKEEMTFFPYTWTKEQCFLKIQESLNNIKKITFDQRRWEVIGTTVEGIEIQSIIEKTGALVTSYPVWN